MLKILIDLHKNYPLLKNISYTDTHLILVYKDNKEKNVLINNDFDTLLKLNY